MNVTQLDRDGILKIAGFVDPEAMEAHQIIYIEEAQGHDLCL